MRADGPRARGDRRWVLGRERLYRWLTVAMFRVGKTRDRDEALLEVAMTAMTGKGTEKARKPLAELVKWL